MTIASITILLALPSFAENAAPPPESFSFPPSPTRIHIAKGLWWQLFRITEAGALMGGAIYDESFDVFGRTNYHGYGKTLGDFPKRPAEFFRHHVIVITGCRAAALSSERQQQLKDWVLKGGGLLVTGGVQGLGRGKYSGTILEELLPVSVSQEDDFRKTSPDAVLAPTAEGSEFFKTQPAWQQKPRLFYMHVDLSLKKGAEVLLKSDNHPALVTWKTGKGRAALFAGTVCGDPKPGELAFWDWDGWPVLLSQTLQWLGTPPPADPRDNTVPLGKAYRAKLEQLKELTDVDVEGLFGDEEAEVDAPSAESDEPDVLEIITRLASHCRGREYALAVVKALDESGTPIKIEQSESLFDSIGRYVSGEKFGGPAKALAMSSNSGRVAIGLRVLARAEIPDGKALALPYVARGLSGLPGKGRTDSLAPAMQVATGEDERLRLAAVRALAEYADETLRAAVRKSAAEWQQQKSPPPNIAELQKDLADEIQLVLCLLGDGHAAVKVLNLMVRNRLKIDENLDITQQPMYTPTPEAIKQRKRLAAEIPHLRRRNARLAATLARFPQSGLQILASKSASWKGALISEYLQACLARRSLKDDLTVPEREALTRIIRECELGPVRTLCFLRLNPSPQEATDLLSQLARGDEPDALFSLSQYTALPESAQAGLVRLGLDHESKKVRHKAAHSIVLSPPKDQAALLKQAKAKSSDDEDLKAILARCGR